ncbi:MAG: hypothetical protein HUK26_07790, partial [Duodenibacillus sp.]|nr:hypothetical protein [Duodenibacillus sp.]
MSNAFMKLAPVAAACLLAVSANAAEKIKDPYHPMVNGSPVTLMKSNMITQSLGGRMLDLDVYVGEFVKHNDNILGTRKDKKGATILATAAGFKAEADQPRAFKGRLEGQLIYNKYLGKSEYNGVEGYLHGNGEVFVADALSLRGLLNFDRDYDNDYYEKDINYINRFEVGAGTTWRPSPYAAVDLDYRFYLQRRVDDELSFQDYNQHEVALRPSYALTENTTIYARASYSHAKPAESRVQKSWGGQWLANTGNACEFAAGATWKYFEDAKVNAQVGVKHMSFKKDGAISDRDDSVTRPTFQIDGLLVLNDDWDVSARLAYAPVYGA